MFSPTIIAFFFLLQLLTLLGVSKLVFDSFITPLGVYAVIWVIAALSYLFSPFPWPQTIGMQTVTALTLNIKCFGLGSLFAVKVRRRYTVQLYTRLCLPVTEREQMFERTFRYALLITGAIGLVSSIALFVKVVSTFGVDVYFSSPGIVRHQITLSSEFKVGRLLGTYLFAVTFASVFFGATYVGYYSPDYLPAYVPLLAVLVHELAILGRWKMVAAGLPYGVAYYLRKREEIGAFSIGETFTKPDLFVKFSSVGVVVFFTLTYLELRSGYYFSKYTELPSVLAEIVLRLNLPIQGLIIILRKPSSHMMGQFSFAALFEMFGAVGLYDYRSLQPFLNRQNPLTPWNERYLAISDLAGMYIDFGWVGLVVFPLILGFLATTWYENTGPLSLLFLLLLSAELIWYIGWTTKSPFFFGAIGILAVFSIGTLGLEYIKATASTEMTERNVSLEIN